MTSDAPLTGGSFLIVKIHIHVSQSWPCLGWLNGLKCRWKDWNEQSFIYKHQVNYIQSVGKDQWPGDPREGSLHSLGAPRSTNAHSFRSRTPTRSTQKLATLLSQTLTLGNSRKAQGTGPGKSIYKQKVKARLTLTWVCTTVQRWEALSHHLK